ncbi:MAG: metal-dependent hydrolase [archaeon]
MNKINHVLFASLLFVVFYMFFVDILSITGPNTFLAFVFCALYSLIPDLDLKSSWIKVQFNHIVLYAIVILGIIYLFIAQEITLLIIIGILILVEIFLQLVNHRDILHTPLVGIMFAIPLLFISYPNIVYFLSGCIGILSHWLLDKIT